MESVMNKTTMATALLTAFMMVGTNAYAELIEFDGDTPKIISANDEVVSVNTDDYASKIIGIWECHADFEDKETGLTGRSREKMILTSDGYYLTHYVLDEKLDELSGVTESKELGRYTVKADSFYTNVLESLFFKDGGNPISRRFDYKDAVYNNLDYVAHNKIELLNDTQMVLRYMPTDGYRFIMKTTCERQASN